MSMLYLSGSLPRFILYLTSHLAPHGRIFTEGLAPELPPAPVLMFLDRFVIGHPTKTYRTRPCCRWRFPTRRTGSWRFLAWLRTKPRNQLPKNAINVLTAIVNTMLSWPWVDRRPLVASWAQQVHPAAPFCCASSRVETSLATLYKI